MAAAAANGIFAGFPTGLAIPSLATRASLARVVDRAAAHDFFAVAAEGVPMHTVVAFARRRGCVGGAWTAFPEAEGGAGLVVCAQDAIARARREAISLYFIMASP